MENKKTIWFPILPSFSLEVALAKAINHDLGSKLYLRQAVGCLPDVSEATPRKEIVVGKLKALHGGKAWMVADATARGVAKTILDLVVGLMRGDPPPRGSFPTGTVMVGVKTRLSYFCQEVSAGVICRGNDALEVRTAALKAAVDDGSLATLEPVTRCEPYSFLLVGAELTALKELCGRARAAVTGASLEKKAPAASAMEKLVGLHGAAKLMKKEPEKVVAKGPKGKKMKNNELKQGSGFVEQRRNG